MYRISDIFSGIVCGHVVGIIELGVYVSTFSAAAAQSPALIL